MNLDLTSLENACTSLERAILRSQYDLSDLEVRDSVIQRFEYTYELCWKMLKRTLELEAATIEEIDHLSFQDLIRTGAERGYIEEPEKWFIYRRQRNITSHIYNEKKAESVFKTACEFINDAKKLLHSLSSRNQP